jgi:hypothetical protein
MSCGTSATGSTLAQPAATTQIHATALKRKGVFIDLALIFILIFSPYVDFGILICTTTLNS